MSYFPGMQKGNLDSVKSDAHGKIKKETVTLQGVSVTRVTFDVGAKWSNDLKDYAGTDSCQLPHVALVLSGTLRVVMDDGSQQDFSRNDVMLLPPGHDAWSVGNEPCVFVEFSRGNDYYAGCAVTRRRFPVGARPTRRFAPAGSNRSRHGGDEMSEAFG